MASFTVSPNTGNSGGLLAITATGTATAWDGSTTFSVTGGTGPTITGTSVNSGAQTATFTLGAGSTAGTLTIHDSTDAATQTVTISTPSFTISTPPVIKRTGRQLGVTVSGTGTNWTTATLFTVSGGTSGLISQKIVSATSAVLVINTGHGATTLTVGTTTDDATATITIVKARKHRRGLALQKRLDFPMKAKG